MTPVKEQLICASSPSVPSSPNYQITNIEKDFRRDIFENYCLRFKSTTPQLIYDHSNDSRGSKQRFSSSEAETICFLLQLSITPVPSLLAALRVFCFPEKLKILVDGGAFPEIHVDSIPA
ncbi:hypothetical protein NC653_015175 [Populus alba x Populus x berolinensis]|uniref:Uncharacterized protein n=1 Tax=Populus alba x Populus x berolinensis TaxID=444605 RepID=A0AAD6VXT7_9ROSI|nr:hypothetical protein NC653_015175 [Populus alba x Populus x berolinensis]